LRKLELEMYCPSCGKEMNNDAKFCPECGKPVTASTEVKASDNPPATPPTTPTQPTNSSQFLKKTLYVSTFVIICFALMMIVIELASRGSSSTISTTTPTSTPTSVQLNASVSFDGSQFIITNNDNFTWMNVTMYLNDDYQYKSPEIPPGNYTLGAMQFTRSDGTRFNPFATKPLQLTIGCTTNTNADGIFGCTW
jgi:endogenous inhibitor of DNA gyrase (YacG/DUF329 family)